AVSILVASKPFSTVRRLMRLWNNSAAATRHTALSPTSAPTSHFRVRLAAGPVVVPPGRRPAAVSEVFTRAPRHAGISPTVNPIATDKASVKAHAETSRD